ncbi:hypothetical protein SAMN06296386_104250 [Lachnospiraceae bacterium]|nr:hypothetical protein SAMN06296386_104250 [Lachnospiraceae bacterium]
MREDGSIALTKLNMSVIDPANLISPEALLVESFTQQIIDRNMGEQAFVPYAELDYLQEGQESEEKKFSPTQINLNYDLTFEMVIAHLHALERETSALKAEELAILDKADRIIKDREKEKQAEKSDLDIVTRERLRVIHEKQKLIETEKRILERSRTNLESNSRYGVSPTVKRIRELKMKEAQELTKLQSGVPGKDRLTEYKNTVVIGRESDNERVYEVGRSPEHVRLEDRKRGVGSKRELESRNESEHRREPEKGKGRENRGATESSGEAESRTESESSRAVQNRRGTESSKKAEYRRETESSRGAESRTEAENRSGIEDSRETGSKRESENISMIRQDGYGLSDKASSQDRNNDKENLSVHGKSQNEEHPVSDKNILNLTARNIAVTEAMESPEGISVDHDILKNSELNGESSAEHGANPYLSGYEPAELTDLVLTNDDEQKNVRSSRQKNDRIGSDAKARDISYQRRQGNLNDLSNDQIHDQNRNSANAGENVQSRNSVSSRENAQSGYSVSSRENIQNRSTAKVIDNPQNRNNADSSEFAKGRSSSVTSDRSQHSFTRKAASTITELMNKLRKETAVGSGMSTVGENGYSKASANVRTLDRIGDAGLSSDAERKHSEYHGLDTESYKSVNQNAVTDNSKTVNQSADAENNRLVNQSIGAVNSNPVNQNTGAENNKPENQSSYTENEITSNKSIDTDGNNAVGQSINTERINEIDRVHRGLIESSVRDITILEAQKQYEMLTGKRITGVLDTADAESKADYLRETGDYGVIELDDLELNNGEETDGRNIKKSGSHQADSDDRSNQHHEIRRSDAGYIDINSGDIGKAAKQTESALENAEQVVKQAERTDKEAKKTARQAEDKLKHAEQISKQAEDKLRNAEQISKKADDTVKKAEESAEQAKKAVLDVQKTASRKDSSLSADEAAKSASPAGNISESGDDNRNTSNAYSAETSAHNRTVTDSNKLNKTTKSRINEEMPTSIRDITILEAQKQYELLTGKKITSGFSDDSESHGMDNILSNQMAYAPEELSNLQIHSDDEQAHSVQGASRSETRSAETRTGANEPHRTTGQNRRSSDSQKRGTQSISDENIAQKNVHSTSQQVSASQAGRTSQQVNASQAGRTSQQVSASQAGRTSQQVNASQTGRTSQQASAAQTASLSQSGHALQTALSPQAGRSSQKALSSIQGLAPQNGLVPQSGLIPQSEQFSKIVLASQPGFPSRTAPESRIMSTEQYIPISMDYGTSYPEILKTVISREIEAGNLAPLSGTVQERKALTPAEKFMRGEVEEVTVDDTPAMQSWVNPMQGTANISSPFSPVQNPMINGVPHMQRQGMNTMHADEAVRQMSQGNQMNWINPAFTGYGMPESLEYKQPGRPDDDQQSGRRRTEVKISEAEVRRTADRVFKMVEERIRKERRRIGRI